MRRLLVLLAAILCSPDKARACFAMSCWALLAAPAWSQTPSPPDSQVVRVVSDERGDRGIEPGNSILLVNAGYMFGKLAATGQTADGNVVSIGFEHVVTPGRTAGFFSIGYGKISDDEGDSTGVLTRTVETIPIYVGAKGYFGKGNFQFHVGGAFGVYFTTVVSSAKQSGEDWSSWSTTGFGMSFPIGLTVCLGKTLFINGEYVLNWTWTNDALESNILNAVVLGLGFRWGKAVAGG